ncbi:MAG: 1,4-dihydroxy-2-naphthoate polyprenyltransferase [Cytophagales bacterium]|nr:1,4-dihydroxy-2-naphthoate polyprenyltransferase [Cytophagales bacterium]
MNAKAWISAARPRTLPLALASIGMGSFLAAGVGEFSLRVFLLCAFTTIFLQVLSNLANDYGDSVHGADSQERQGPQRAVQSGVISARQMRTAMIVFALLSLCTGVWLLYEALKDASARTIGLFFGLGLCAIAAAVTYTAGKRPYGYAGLGDVSVLLFFGLLGVLGTYYLHVKSISPLLVLPALSCGFFATAVLNVNNIRDIESDRKAGKKSIPVRLGRAAAVRYHWLLLGAGLLCAVAYVALTYASPWQLLFLVTLPLLGRNALAVKRNRNAVDLDPYLKQMALTTLLFVLTFGLGQLI